MTPQLANPKRSYETLPRAAAAARNPEASPIDDRSKAAAEIPPELAFGCVDWFMYAKEAECISAVLPT